jgi:signal transduction histidine kinase
MLSTLARLVEVSLTLNSTLELDELLNLIIAAAMEELKCEAASLLLYDEQRGQLNFISASGSDPGKLAEIPVPLHGSLAGTIFRDERPLVINDVRNDPRHYRQVSEQVGFQTRSLVGVPMRTRDKVTGVLEALNKTQGVFGSQDVHILSILASQAAVAIRNAQMVNALRQANEDLLRLEKMKRQFMAVVSHELRTPLGIILGYASLLKDQDPEGECSSMVLTSALQLRELVERMANLNLLQLGVMEVKLTPTPLQEVIRSVCADLVGSVSAKSLHLSLEAPEEDLMVEADPEKLHVVFENILSNAVRFTPGGGEISIRIQGTLQEAVVSITDTGIGLASGEPERIFSSFYQVEEPLTRRAGGIGLGLAIARELVELHKGQIWAESGGLGKGTTIRVRVPML